MSSGIRATPKPLSHFYVGYKHTRGSKSRLVAWVGSIPLLVNGIEPAHASLRRGDISSRLFLMQHERESSHCWNANPYVFSDLFSMQLKCMFSCAMIIHRLFCQPRCLESPTAEYRTLDALRAAKGAIEIKRGLIAGWSSRRVSIILDKDARSDYTGQEPYGRYSRAWMNLCTTPHQPVPSGACLAV